MKHLHGALALTAAALGGGSALSELRPATNVAHLAVEIEKGADHISALSLGESIMHGERDLMVIDLRTQSDYETAHIPGAERTTLQELSARAMPISSTIVLYSEGGAHAAQAWVLLRLRGYQRVFFLREGIYEWISCVMDPRLAVDATDAERAEFSRAEKLSRFFGGIPLAGVARSEVPTGYWTGLSQDAPQAVTRPKTRRRGC